MATLSTRARSALTRLTAPDARRRARTLRALAKPNGTVSFDQLPNAAAVRLAFNVVLEREPEPAGWDNYMSHLRVDMSPMRMVRIMRWSEESLMSVRPDDFENSLHLSRCDFVRTLPRAERILDLGGTHQSNREGAFIHLGYPYPFGRLVIVDLPMDERHELYARSEAADIVQTTAGPVEYAYHSMADLSRYDDASFDLVYSGQTIEHVTEDDCDKVLSEVRRVLRPGGWFAVDTPNAEVCRLDMPDQLINPDHKIEYTHQEFSAKLHASGFEIVDAKGLNYLGHPLSSGLFDRATIAHHRGLYGEPESCYLLAYLARTPAR